MRVTRLTDEVLRSLSEVEADEAVVVSMFVDLDAPEFATAPARDSRINSLLNALDARIREADLSDDAEAALAVDRERIESFLRDELDVSEAGTIAIYSAHALDVFQAIKLGDPVESDVRIDLRPILEPLMGHEDEGDWCVLLVTRDTARVFRGGPTGLREIGEVSSDVKNQHQAGGWSQARFERSVEQEVEWHLEAVTDELFRYSRRRPFEHLVIGANNGSLRPALSDETHSYLLEKVRGWVDIDEGIAGDAEVFAAVRPVMDEFVAGQERELLERLEAGLATGGNAAAGLEDVLRALVEQRVETLIVTDGAEAPGTKCVTCGWLGTAGHSSCPVDETTLDRVDNVIEPAIQSAIQQSAGVHVLRPAEDAEAPAVEAPFDGPVAAVLRF